MRPWPSRAHPAGRQDNDDQMAVAVAVAVAIATKSVASVRLYCTVPSYLKVGTVDSTVAAKSCE